jgi:hypothetical protein
MYVDFGQDVWGKPNQLCCLRPLALTRGKVADHLERRNFFVYMALQGFSLLRDLFRANS